MKTRFVLPGRLCLALIMISLPLCSFGEHAPVARAASVNLFPVSLPEGYGYIDSSGVVAIPPRYDDAKTFRDGYARVKIDGQWGFIDARGTLAVANRYDRARNFSGGLAPVKMAGLWGYVDTDGVRQIRPIYEEAWEFNGAYAVVQLDGRLGVIDRKGGLRAPAIYDEIDERGYGLAAVRIGGKRGYLDLAQNRFLDAAEFSRLLELEKSAALAETLASVQPLDAALAQFPAASE